MPTTKPYTGPPSTHTKPRSVRVDGPLWEGGKLAAEVSGLTLSDVINRAIATYVLDRMTSADIDKIDREALERLIPAAELRRIITHIDTRPQWVSTAL